jgi:hypothetical protein
MRCHDCGQELPARPWGRRNGDELEQLCTMCLVRWRESLRRPSAAAALVGWLALLLLGAAVVVAVLGSKT